MARQLLGRLFEETECDHDRPMMNKQQISNEVLAYLVEHPDAQDTLEGILEWWLLERQIKFQTARVKEVLSELVAKGLDSEVMLIPREKLLEVRALLDGKLLDGKGRLTQSEVYGQVGKPTLSIVEDPWAGLLDDDP